MICLLAMSVSATPIAIWVSSVYQISSLGISDQLVDGRETSRDRISALCFKLTPERVPGGEAEEAALETSLEKGVIDRHK
jgi:hypothetical protein